MGVMICDNCKWAEIQPETDLAGRYVYCKKNHCYTYPASSCGYYENKMPEYTITFTDATDSTEDIINHPQHYAGTKIETLDYIEDKGFCYHLGQVVKYVSRAGRKGDMLEDLKKAKWYLDRKIKLMEEGE